MKKLKNTASTQLWPTLGRACHIGMACAGQQLSMQRIYVSSAHTEHRRLCVCVCVWVCVRVCVYLSVCVLEVCIATSREAFWDPSSSSFFSPSPSLDARTTRKRVFLALCCQTSQTPLPPLCVCVCVCVCQPVLRPHTHTHTHTHTHIRSPPHVSDN